jgi:hypothetical protein
LGEEILFAGHGSAQVSSAQFPLPGIFPVTDLASVNPLTWSTDENFASKEKNIGGVSYGFKYVKEFADAQNHQGILWTNTPYVPGRSFVKLKNWHKADINLYYQNIRENAVQRVQTFLSQK